MDGDVFTLKPVRESDLGDCKMATLLVVEGPSEGLKFALGQHNLVMIGRDHSATLQILDGRMSRFHVQIKRAPEGEGHVAKDFDVPEMIEIVKRGILWAARERIVPEYTSPKPKRKAGKPKKK